MDTQRDLTGQKGMPKETRPFEAQKILFRGAGVTQTRHGKAFCLAAHRQSPWPGESPAHPGWDTHHLLQLVLDLPVDFCHLEEHISCKDKM